MKSLKLSTRNIVYGAIIAALYTAISYLQNFLLPGSATWAVQFRVAEALCVLALFTPAAVPGLTVGCILFNFCFVNSLPLDVFIGSAATLLAVWGMYITRNITIKGYPLLAMLLPALCNGVLIGWELSVFLEGRLQNFWFYAANVALGEAAVLPTLGTALFYALRKYQNRIFR